MHFNQVLSFVFLLGVVHTTPLPELIDTRTPSLKSTRTRKECPDYCAGTNFNQSLVNDYICGDFRLGPKRLPTRLPVFDLVDNYDRFGGLCPGQFLAKWYNATAGSYIYPTLNGFQLNTVGAPIQGNITFAVGFLIDRFGSEFGSFVSPEGAPYDQRALPPSNLNTPAGDRRCVLREGEVEFMLIFVN
jgi:hypothetical protein